MLPDFKVVVVGKEVSHPGLVLPGVLVQLITLQLIGCG